MDTEISAYEMGARGEALEDSEDEPLWFQQLMEIYPVKTNRHAALREARRIAPTLELQATILRAVRALRASDKWQKGFAPDARNFLRDRRWRDAEGLPVPAETPKVKYGTEAALQHQAAWKQKVEKCDPEVAKAAMREGLVEGWKERHPNQDPPPELLADPIGYITGRSLLAKGMKSGAVMQADTAEARRQAMAELESVKFRMRGEDV